MKKYFVIILGLTFLFILTLISDYSNLNVTKVNYTNEGKIGGTITVDEEVLDDTEDTETTIQPIILEKLTVQYDEENNELIYTDTFQLIDSLVLESDVSITNIKTIDNTFIALGSKNNKPYMQEFIIIDHNIVSTSNPLIYSDKLGSIIDIVQDVFYIEVTMVDDNNNQFTQKLMQTNDQLVPYYKEQIQYNYTKDRTIVPEYLVIHETGNTKAGADANAHFRYWNTNPNANASTHFVVDNTQVYQMLELNNFAWHVGDNRGYSDITNANSIGIEIAVNSDGDYMEARQHTIELTIKIMNSLDMDISQLKRHYDASGKICPEIMVVNPELWDDFVAQVQAGLEK